MGPMIRIFVVLLMLVASIRPVNAQDRVPSAESCGLPTVLGDGWKLGTPAEVGLDPQTLCEINTLVRQWPEANIHAVNVVRHGRLVLELYYRGQDQRYGQSLGVVQFAPDVKHDLRSVSKSVTSMLVGIALSEGKFPPLDSPVLETFSEYADLRTPEKMRITFRHLLTMSPGLTWDETSNPYGDGANSWHQLVTSKDPVRFVLEQPLASAPGSAFTYSSGDTTVLGRAVANATGRRLDEYARAKLFDALGISDFEWGPLHSTAETAAASALRLRPRDTAKLGQIMLTDGLWGDRRILPSGWAAESMKARIEAGRYHYGYQWWLGETAVEGGGIKWAAAFGYGGQRLFIVPALDLIVVVNAGVYDGPYSRLQDRIPSEILRQVIQSGVATRR